MIRVLTNKWTYRALKVIGLVFLVFYFIAVPNYDFSVLGVLGYVAISTLVAALVVSLNLGNRLPKLNNYLCSQGQNDAEGSMPVWVAKKAAYLKSGMRWREIFLSPAEDGFVCVPVLLHGINAITSTAGGAVFGLLHLGRFSYLECLSKMAIYSLVCLFILPHGILTVIAGHFVMNMIGLAVLKRVPTEASRTTEP